MIRHLNVLDAAFLIIALVSLLAGFVRGLVSELFAFGFMILGIVLAFAFYPQAALLWSRLVSDARLARFYGFLTLFLAVAAIGAAMTRWLKKIASSGPLEPLDRILGGAFGLAKALVLSWIIVFGALSLKGGNDILRQSRLTPCVMESFRLFLNLVPEKTRGKIDSLQPHDQQKDSRDRRTI